MLGQELLLIKFTPWDWNKQRNPTYIKFIKKKQNKNYTSVNMKYSPEKIITF